MLEDMSNSPSTSRRHSKQSQENWDDDFEFALPAKRGGTGKSSSSNSKGKGKDENIPLPRGDSPIEDWDENWDESPPRSIPPTTIKHERKKSSIPPPINIPSSSTSRMNPPRLSPSHSTNLQTSPSPTPFSTSPLPTSFSSSPQQPLLPSRSHSSIGLNDNQHATSSRTRSGSTTAGTITRNKLVKRHPSTSFVPIQSNSSSTIALNTTLNNPSDASLGSISLINRSSPNLPHGSPSIPRSTSGDQMPPPPLPQGGFLGRARSRSKSKVRPESRQGIRISSIPFSPSSYNLKDQDKEREKKPGFWKRLSGAPTGATNDGAGTPQHRRRRSSSVGAKHLPSGSPRPPVPPLPMNLRSPSGSSNTSNSSAKSGPASAFSALLRRSSSSLSKRSDKFKDTPPSSYPYSSSKHGMSSSSVNSFIQQPVSIPSSRRGDVTPDVPSSSSFSRGFHLPSPSPGSPYKSRMPSASIGHVNLPPLPHSTSFPGPRAQGGSGSDTETEGEGKTPRRRKKIRPVSALPAPRSTSGFQGNNWAGINNESTHQIPGLPISRQSSIEFNSAKLSSSPSGFASSTTSTLKRLGSLSKKHGRRLSGGWKFGTNSSSDSNKSQNRQLEPVLGSPSKPYKNNDGDLPLSPISPSPDSNLNVDDLTEEEMRKAIRAGSVSAPTSMFKPPPVLADSSQLENTNSEMEVEVKENIEKKEKHRRRQSWNDFVIPREVMMKQKELKEGIGAVKMFAGGVATLKTLLSTHANIRDRILASGSPNDAASFALLDSEFEQWLEMAVVLIEVGSTGADPSNQPSFSSPPRSRRVTLASDEAKAASAAMSKAISLPVSGSGKPTPPVQLSSWRKASLPDPEENNFNSMIGPPRAEFPEQWRASTGRQDLSKRQLEVLRTMLRTPMSNIPDPSIRPGMGIRTSSTLSAASINSTNSYLQVSTNQGSPSPNSRIQSRSKSRIVTRESIKDESSISFPSPNDSTYIKPSNSFPSPISAAKMMQQPSTQKSLKDRRASKAGLAGLKEFLRSLKKENKSSNNLPGGNGLSPLRIKNKFGFKSSTSPPASPTSPLSSYFNSTNTNTKNDVFYPTQRSSFSALGPNANELNIPQTPQNAPLLQSGFMSTTKSNFNSKSGLGSRSRSSTQTDFSNSSSSSSPRLLGNEQKRPSIRNIFRTSSGNWSELVKNDQSSNSNSNSITSSPSSGITNGSPSSGLSKKSSAQRLGFSLKPSISNSSSSTSTLGGMNKISVSDPIPSKLPLPHSSSSKTLSANDYGLNPNLGLTKNGENDLTLRPNVAKKRTSGLGLGLGWPETGGISSSPIKTSNGSGIGEMGTVYESPSKMDQDKDGTMKPLSSRNYSNEDSTPTSSSKIRFPSYGSYNSNSASTSNRIPSSSTTYTNNSSSYPTIEEGYNGNGIRSSEDSNDNEIDQKDLTIALTPENLPTLLEYLRQCERMLGHWRERVEEVVGGIEG